MKKLSLLVISIFVSIICTSQELGDYDIDKTVNYLKRLLEDNYISSNITKVKSIDGYLTECSDQVEYDKYRNNLYDNGVVNLRTARHGEGFWHKISFNLNDVIIEKTYSQNGLYLFNIKCNINKECITVEKKLQNKFTFSSSSLTTINRFRNALSHLQNIVINDPKLKPVNDPFDNYENKKTNTLSIDISNIKFIDENNNNRIDQTEKVTLSLTIKNYNQSNASNLKIEIKEVNGLKGFIFEENHIITTLIGKQSRIIEIGISSNNELEIGEANFEIKVFNNNVELTRKSVKIATFNSGAQEFIISKLSNVDIDIPKTASLRRNTYAIIIGNEDYKSKQPNLSYESNVKYALNDAKIFKEYLTKTLGVPSTNISYLANATSAEIKQAINKVKQLPLVNSNAEIIFYYAGHGLPDEKTKEQYLIPVDVNSANINYGLKINEIETELSSNNPKQILLILDACFSGAARNESLLSSRAVRVRPKENEIKGNSIILSASSSEEASKAYDEMQHGMFTYFLLKKIQETKGNVDLQTLFDYVHFNVREKSLLINNQFQTPTITKSPQIQNNLNEIKF